MWSQLAMGPGIISQMIEGSVIITTIQERKEPKTKPKPCVPIICIHTNEAKENKFSSLVCNISNAFLLLPLFLLLYPNSSTMVQELFNLKMNYWSKSCWKSCCKKKKKEGNCCWKIVINKTTKQKRVHVLEMSHPCQARFKHMLKVLEKDHSDSNAAQK